MQNSGVYACEGRVGGLGPVCRSHCSGIILKYAYWNATRGLIAARGEVKREWQTVRFGKPIETVLLEYRWR